MKTVVISGARSLPALKLARAFARLGVRVVTTDSLVFATAAVSSACNRYVRTSSPKRDTPRFHEEVARLLEEEKPDLWIPTCEEIFYLAQGCEKAFPEIPLFAPSFVQLARFHDKARFAAFAAKMGAGPAETHYLTDNSGVQALRDQARNLVFKPVWSRGGERVLIQPHEQQLGDLHPTEQDPWIAQTYLPGEEICTYSIAVHGRLVAHAAYRPYHRPGLGPALALEQVDEVETKALVTTFVEATAWHGQIGFDLRRDKDGRLLVIECNPRATSGIHFLSEAHLAEACTGKEIVPDKNTPMPIIQLALLTYGLPAALRKSGLSGYLADCRKGKDVIWDWKDPLPALQQIPFTLETAWLGLRRKISMHAAFTDDLEWDGDSAY